MEDITTPRTADSGEYGDAQKTTESSSRTTQARRKPAKLFTDLTAGREKQFFKNYYGISIVKCCASCKHKQFDKGSSRLCMKGEGNVTPSYLCNDWEMNEKLQKAGMGGGRVRRIEYLRYCLDFPQPRDPLLHVPLNVIRDRYEKATGKSIYINKY